jgi:hypothetical protein
MYNAKKGEKVRSCNPNHAAKDKNSNSEREKHQQTTCFNALGQQLYFYSFSLYHFLLVA